MSDYLTKYDKLFGHATMKESRLRDCILSFVSNCRYYFKNILLSEQDFTDISKGRLSYDICHIVETNAVTLNNPLLTKYRLTYCLDCYSEQVNRLKNTFSSEVAQEIFLDFAEMSVIRLVLNLDIE